MKAPKNIESAVQSVLIQFSEAYANRDASLLRATFAGDSDVVLYGTGADEKRVGLVEIQQQAERDWSQSDEASMAYGWMSVSSAGPVAWVAADVTFNLKVGGQALSLPARLTAVLEMRAEQWLIVQAHFSFPSGTQAEGESFPK